MSLDTEKKAHLEKEKISLDLLITEAGKLFNALDENSNLIRSLEKELRDRKIHIPFSILIKTEKESEAKALEDRHKNIYSREFEFFTTQIKWLLSWEEDPKNENYRLLLLSVESERLYSKDPYDEYSSSLFQKKRLFQKPFIETDFQTRFCYADSLHIFIEAFYKHIKDKRISIPAQKE